MDSYMRYITLCSFNIQHPCKLYYDLYYDYIIIIIRLYYIMIILWNTKRVWQDVHSVSFHNESEWWQGAVKLQKLLNMTILKACSQQEQL